jgi:hypothetical protein
LYRDVGSLIVSKENRFEVCMEDLGLAAFRHVGAYDVDVAGGSAWRDSANAVKQIENRLRSLKQHAALSADHLPYQENLLAAVLRDTYMHLCRRHFNLLCQAASYLGHSKTLDTEPAGSVTLGRNVESTIKVDFSRATELRPRVYCYFQDIGTAYNIVVGHGRTSRGEPFVGQKGLIEVWPAVGATEGRQ